MTAHHGGSRSTSAHIVGVQFGDEHKYEKYERISTFNWVNGAPGDERERLLEIGCGASVVAVVVGDEPGSLSTISRARLTAADCVVLLPSDSSDSGHKVADDGGGDSLDFACPCGAWHVMSRGKVVEALATATAPRRPARSKPLRVSVERLAP
jgi:hypothetical protein